MEVLMAVALHLVGSGRYAPLQFSIQQIHQF